MKLQKAFEASLCIHIVCGWASVGVKRPVNHRHSFRELSNHKVTGWVLICPQSEMAASSRGLMVKTMCNKFLVIARQLKTIIINSFDQAVNVE